MAVIKQLTDLSSRGDQVTQVIEQLAVYQVAPSTGTTMVDTQTLPKQ